MNDPRTKAIDPAAGPEQTLPDPNATVDQPEQSIKPDTVDVTGAYQSAPGTVPTVNAPSVGAPRIPGYVITGEIAKGGMGRVLAARESTLDREVAIKVLLPGANADRFITESKITAKLPHPNIPPVYVLGTLDDGSPYLAMKLIRGRTLADELKARADVKAELPRFVQIFEQIAQAVGFAHAQGIIHRDLKPANVMVGAFGEVQVMDWGLAKKLSKHSEPILDKAFNNTETNDSISHADPFKSNAYPADSLETPKDRTRAGTVMGTPAYMAPEQARGELDIDQRADVFGLGAILCQILTKQPPFGGKSMMTTLVQAAAGELTNAFARLDACGVEPDLVALCKRCLSAEMTVRPMNAEEVAKAVASLRAAADERARQAELDRAKATEQRKRRKVQLALVGATLLLIAAGSVGVGFASLWRKAEVNREEAIHQRAKLAVFEYGGTIRVAHQEWRDGNVAEMRILLDGTDPLLRGWEWNYLDRLYYPYLLNLKGHTSDLTSVSFNSDGTRIVTASYDKSARVWDAKSGTELFTFKHMKLVRSASFNPDGTRIVTASWDNTAKVWDANSGVEVLTLKHKYPVWSALYSPDGTRIVTTSLDNIARVYDAYSGAELLTLNGLTRARASSDGIMITVLTASYSPDGTRIVTTNYDDAAAHNTLRGKDEYLIGSDLTSLHHMSSGDNHSVRVWDANSGVEVLKFKQHAKKIYSISYSTNSKMIVAICEDHIVRVLDAYTGDLVFELQGHTDHVHSAMFRHDSSFVVTASDDKTARVWDLKTGKEVLALKGHTGSVLSASFSTDGTHVVTASNDNSVRVWDAKIGTVALIFKGHTGSLYSASFSVDGTRVLTACTDKSVRVWDARSGVEVLILKELKGGVTNASFSPDGTRLVTRNSGNIAKVWDTGSGVELCNLKELKGGVTNALFSPDGTQIVTGSADNTAKVWDAKTGVVILTLQGHKGIVNVASFSPDGTRIVTGSADNTAKVWDAKTGDQLQTFYGHERGLLSASFSPDGTRVVTASGEGDPTARIWDAKTGDQLQTFYGHERGLLSASFSPDGTRVVTASQDRTVRVWDVNTADLACIIKGHTSSVLSASFSPNGCRIVTSGGDMTARLWDTKTGAELLTFKGHTGPVHAASFSPEGSRIVTASQDGTIRIWDSRPFRESLPPDVELSPPPKAIKP